MQVRQNINNQTLTESEKQVTHVQKYSKSHKKRGNKKHARISNKDVLNSKSYHHQATFEVSSKNMSNG